MVIKLKKPGLPKQAAFDENLTIYLHRQHSFLRSPCAHWSTH